VHVCTNGKCVCANRDTGDLTTNKEKGPHHQYQTTSKGDRITPPTSPTSLITSHAAKPRPQRKTTSSRHTLLLSLSRAPAPSHISVVSTCPPYPLGVWQSHLSRGTCYVYREHNIYIYRTHSIYREHIQHTSCHVARVGPINWVSVL
jgi:hypothetical protein